MFFIGVLSRENMSPFASVTEEETGFLVTDKEGIDVIL